MRKADIDHAWDECRDERRQQLRVGNITALHDLGSDDLVVTSRLTAFIGPNGVGKTSFLKSLSSIFMGEFDQLARPPIQRISGFYRGRDFTIDSPDNMATPQGLAAEYVSISLDVYVMQQFFEGQAHLDELLEQYEPNSPSQLVLGLYRHICARDFDSVTVLEVEAPASPGVAEAATEDSEDLVFPFFCVEVAGLKYDNRSMGFGELCACYLVWKLHRSRSGAVILLDEPDSHLSPASRRALSDALALLAKERELWIAFTTHSIELLEQMRETEVFLVHVDTIRDTPRIVPAETRRNAIRALGLASQRRLLIVVEDVDARAAVWYMVNRWASDIADSIDVQVVFGGATEVDRFVSLFPADARVCRALAVLDGDKRGAFADASNTILFLPGQNDPIEAAVALVQQNCETFADKLGVDPVVLRRTLMAIAHVNHHDFLATLLARQRIEGMTVEDVRKALIGAWMSDPIVAEQARALVTGSITDAVNAIPWQLR
ncbi:AAA family ATPase [Paraburkholderia terrae]|uniref:AAA family ATPase n=1 Tax=Paraburkholderia terrae TaxID=311230 RepID=UPI00296A914D|nr:AAA family ATPase [Paraburkholderia terrae]MDW3660376.1 AAA family ATPase [Paraburkholderia terrae]